MKILSFLLIFIYSNTIYCEEPVIEQFAEEIRHFTVKNTEECKILKIEHDLDENGTTDILLSSYCGFNQTEYWGKLGGPWNLYLKVEGRFIKYPSLYFTPFAVGFNGVKKEGEFVLTKYSRISAIEGSVSTLRITSSSIEVLDGKHYGGENPEENLRYENIGENFKNTHRPLVTYCVLSDIAKNTCSWEEGGFESQ